MMAAEPTIRLRGRLFVLEIVDRVTGDMTKVCCATAGRDGATELMMVTVAGVDSAEELVLAMLPFWASQENVLPEVSSWVSTALCCKGGDAELEGDTGSLGLSTCGGGGEFPQGRWPRDTACLATAPVLGWCLEPLCGEDMLRDLMRLLGTTTLGMAKLTLLPPVPGTGAWSAGANAAATCAAMAAPNCTRSLPSWPPVYEWRLAAEPALLGEAFSFSLAPNMAATAACCSPLEGDCCWTPAEGSCWKIGCSTAGAVVTPRAMPWNAPTFGSDLCFRGGGRPDLCRYCGVAGADGAKLCAGDCLGAAGASLTC